MVNIKYSKLASVLAETIALASEQKRIVTVAAGIYASRTFNIPTGVVENPSAHFDDFVLLPTEELLSQFNENILIDYQQAFNVAKAFWLLRYQTAFPNKSVPVQTAPNVAFLNRITGFNTYLDNDTACYIDQYSEKIARALNLIENTL